MLLKLCCFRIRSIQRVSLCCFTAKRKTGGEGETGEHMQQNWEFLGHTNLKFKPPDTNFAGHVVNANGNGGCCSRGTEAAWAATSQAPATNSAPKWAKFSWDWQERSEGKARLHQGLGSISLGETWTIMSKPQWKEATALLQTRWSPALGDGGISFIPTPASSVREWWSSTFPPLKEA